MIKSAVLCFMIFIYFKIYADDLKNIVIYSDEDIPYVTVNKEGIIDGGLATEVMYKVLNKLKLPKSTIENVPWARAYFNATTKPNVIIYPIVKTTERLEKLDFIIKILDSTVFLYKLKSRTDIIIKNLDEAKKHRICAVRDDYRADYLKANNFEDIDLATNSTLNVKKFIEGRCDLIISTEIGIQNKLKSLKYEFNLIESIFPLKNLDSALYAAINKNTSKEIKDKIKIAAESIK